MSTQKHSSATLQQGLEQSNQIRNSSWKKMLQNGLTGIVIAATIVA
jgi:hypothetical protein